MSVLKAVVALLACGAALSSAAALDDKKAENYLYKYTNGKGQVVIDQRVPPEFVPKGYTILSERTGLVVKVVAPSLSDDERTKALAQKQKQAVQHASDDQLLKTYSTVDDAERSRDRQIEALDVIIGVTMGNITRSNAQYQNEQQRAAEAERAGREVPADTLTIMKNLKRQAKEG